MEKASIKVGEEYGIRERRRPGEPMQHIRILERVRGNKWKAEWIDPNPGLKDYIESRFIIVRWKDRKAFLRDEDNERRLHEHNAQAGYKHDDAPVESAVLQVFEEVGDDVHFYHGVLSGSPDALTRVKDRARLDSTKHSPVTYVARDGKIHAPFDEALELARAFCAAEPNTVLVGVESTEREWSEKAGRPGGEYMVGLLNDYRAAWAIIRQWTGLDPAIAAREAQIQRLERLVWDAVYALQKAGLDAEARRLRRALGGD